MVNEISMSRDTKLYISIYTVSVTVNGPHYRIEGYSCHSGAFP